MHRCYCSRDGTSIPGDLALEDTPQMVLIMLGEAATSSLQPPASAAVTVIFADGAVNQNNFPYYKRLFKNLTNPNGCAAQGTFFLLHDYTNYHQADM